MTTRLTTQELEDFTYLFIEVRGNYFDRVDILNLEFPEINGTKGLIMSCGKIPYWLIAPVISHYRNKCKWQAIKESGKPISIVVMSFDPGTPVASEIATNFNCLICGDGLRVDTIYPYCEKHKNHAPERQTYRKKK